MKSGSMYFARQLLGMGITEGVVDLSRGLRSSNFLCLTNRSSMDSSSRLRFGTMTLFCDIVLDGEDDD